MFGRSHLHGRESGFFDLDETKIVLRVDDLRMTGYEVQRMLNVDHGVQPELGGASHVLFIITIGNTDEDIERLITGVQSIAQKGRPSMRPGVPAAASSRRGRNRATARGDHPA